MGEPSNHVFNNAKQYLNIARYCEDNGYLQEVSIAAVSNYAFSIELMLKALDAIIVPSVSVNNGLLSDAVTETNVRGHDLMSIYKKLPENTRKTLSSKFQSKTGKEIEPALNMFKDYFVLSRYYHEPKSQNAYRISELRDLAEGIEFSLSSWYA